MKILVAGGGAFGKEHLKTLSAIGDVALAVAEPRASELEQLGSMFQLAERDADALALIERFQPDGIVVATPASAHAQLAIAALERQIPVLVEKPVTPDTAAMRQLCEIAAKSRTFLLPGHVLRFSSAHRQLVDLLKSGEIGDLVQFNSRRYRDDSHATRYTDVDPVMMTMIHDIDLAVWFTGDGAVSARAVRRPAGQSRSITTAWLEGAQGGVWQLATAWLHPGQDCPADRVEIIGTKGSAELVAGSHIELFGETRRRVDIDVADDPLRTELECFLAGIRSGNAPTDVTPDDALQGLVAAELVMDALASR